jgi:hypothetical protein
MKNKTQIRKQFRQHPRIFQRFSKTNRVSLQLHRSRRSRDHNKRDTSPAHTFSERLGNVDQKAPAGAEPRLDESEDDYQIEYH